MSIVLPMDAIHITIQKESYHFTYFLKKNAGTVKIINKFGEEETVDRLLAWTKKLKMGKNVSQNMRICSLHFSDSNYINPGK